MSQPWILIAADDIRLFMAFSVRDSPLTVFEVLRKRNLIQQKINYKQSLKRSASAPLSLLDIPSKITCTLKKQNLRKTNSLPKKCWDFNNCTSVPIHSVENDPMFIGQPISTKSKVFIERNENNVDNGKVSAMGIDNVNVMKGTSKQNL